jgi:hypothetical protein
MTFIFSTRNLHTKLSAQTSKLPKTQVNSEEQQQLFVTAFPPFFHFKVFMFAREEKLSPPARKKAKNFFRHRKLVKYLISVEQEENSACRESILILSRCFRENHKVITPHCRPKVF